MNHGHPATRLMSYFTQVHALWSTAGGDLQTEFRLSQKSCAKNDQPQLRALVSVREYELLRLTPQCPAVVRAPEMDTHEGRLAFGDGRCGRRVFARMRAASRFRSKKWLRSEPRLRTSFRSFISPMCCTKTSNPSNIVIHPKTRQVQIIDFASHRCCHAKIPPRAA